jgi:hypothetical protein
MSAIQNLRQMLLFRLVAFGIVGIGVFAVFESNLPPLLAYGSMVWAVAALIAVWLIVNPTYVCFDFVNGKLFIGTDKEDSENFHLVMPLNEFAAYEIVKEYGGMRKTLHIYRKVGSQFQRSKGTNLSLFTAKQLKQLKARFADLQEKNGTTGLRFRQ